MAQQFDSVDRIAHATIVTAPDREENVWLWRWTWPRPWCARPPARSPAASAGPAERRGRVSTRTLSA